MRQFVNTPITQRHFLYYYMSSILNSWSRVACFVDFIRTSKQFFVSPALPVQAEKKPMRAQYLRTDKTSSIIWSAAKQLTAAPINQKKSEAKDESERTVQYHPVWQAFSSDRRLPKREVAVYIVNWSINLTYLRLFVDTNSLNKRSTCIIQPLKTRLRAVTFSNVTVCLLSHSGKNSHERCFSIGYSTWK